MPVFSTAQIPKTNNSDEFQRQCKILFECILEDPNVQEYGRSGQGQDGVDLYGRRKNCTGKPKVGIQCKQTGKTKLDKKIVADEATKALKFEPALDEFIIVTTAEDDKELQDEARKFTAAQEKEGRDFEVNVWGWKTISTKVLEHEKAIKAFMPEYSPFTDTLLQGQDALIGGQEQHLYYLQQIDKKLGMLNPEAASGVSSWGEKNVATEDLDRRIDQYRDLINDNKPQTAYDLLESLEKEIPADIDPRIKYRIIANKAACNLRLGNMDIAAKGYLESYAICPDAPKADAHKVLGLVLQNKDKEAFNFGLECISKTQDQQALFTNLLIAKKGLPEEETPFEFIPDEIQDDTNILIAKIDYLRSFNNRPAWRELAHYAAENYPDDNILKRFDAEATLDDICEKIDASVLDRLDPDSIEKIQAVANILKPLWEVRTRSENAWDDYHLSLTSNLANAYRIISDFPAAASVLDQGLAHAPEDEHLLERRFLVAAEQNDLSKIEELLPRLPITRDTVLGHLQWINNSEKWHEIRNIPPMDNVADLRESDKAFYEALSGVALYKLGDIPDIKKHVSALEEKYPNEIITQIVFHQIALMANDKAWADELYQKASVKKEQLSQSGRFMLAHIAEIQEDPELVIELLEENVDFSKDSEDLRTLARAYVNAKVRKSSVQFTQKLNKELKNHPYYARVIASIHFNRGALEEAEKYFRKVLEKEPYNLYGHIGLIQTFLRDDRKEEINQHLKDLDVNRLSGPEIYKMHMAHLMAAYGRGNDALDYGYKIAVANFDNPKILLLYTGMLLPNARNVVIPEVKNEVQIDTYVEFIDDDQKKHAVFIADGMARPSINHYPPDHETAKLLLGKKVGDTAIKKAAYGTDQTWKIISIKSKFIGLFNEISETFNTRFPDHGGFYVYKTKEGDVTPILEDIKRFSEKDDRLVEMYEKQHFPMEFAANICGDHFGAVANQIINKRGFIRSCVGNVPERNHAVDLCITAFEHGICLDTYTAWAAYNLEILPILKKLFPRIVIARSTLDELYERKRYFESHGDQSFMTIKYEDGKYYREEVTPERIQTMVESVDNIINDFREAFEIIPAEAPGSLSEFEQQLTAMGGTHLLDPCYIAMSEGLTLLSDDMHYRGLLQQLHNVEGIWLQIPLMMGLEKEKITISDYTKAIINLAKARHAHITLTAAILIEACRLGDANGLNDFSQLMEFIGGPNADPRSHINVAEEFIEVLWDIDGVSDLNKAKATGITLERIAGLATRFEAFDEVFKEILGLMSGKQRIRDYIQGWLRGHFIELK